jgi:methionyl-tRNA formyltransferase
MQVGGAILKIHKACSEAGDELAGRRLVYRNQLAVGTGSGLLILDEVQPAGKKSMNGAAFLSGARGWEN